MGGGALTILDGFRLWWVSRDRGEIASKVMGAMNTFDNR